MSPSSTGTGRSSGVVSHSAGLDSAMHANSVRRAIGLMFGSINSAPQITEGTVHRVVGY
jgi:hypothetical protein